MFILFLTPIKLLGGQICRALALMCTCVAVRCKDIFTVFAHFNHHNTKSVLSALIHNTDKTP